MIKENPRGPEFARRLTSRERDILDRVLAASHPTATRPGRWARSASAVAVAAGVAVVVLLMVGGLAALRTDAAAPPMEHTPASPPEPASTMLARLATAAAGQPTTDTSLTRQWLHLVLHPEAGTSICKGMAAALTRTVIRAAPLPEPQVWSLTLQPWRPADEHLRAEGCDPARTALTFRDGRTVEYLMPADKQRLTGLPSGLQQLAAGDERLIGRISIVDIEASAEAVRRAMDAGPDPWWQHWVQLMVSPHATHDQRVAALTAAAARADARTVTWPVVDLAGRSGVTIQVPYGERTVADLTFDEATGTLLQYRVSGDETGLRQVTYTTLLPR